MILGAINWEQLRSDPESGWFATGYDLFSFDDGGSYRALLSAQPVFHDLEILVFIGTWCPDCQEQVPGFARILDTIRFPVERLRVFNLDRSKTFPGGEALIAAHAIRRLPTFVVLRKGKEIGRITEAPRQSLLADLAAILSGSP